MNYDFLTRLQNGESIQDITDELTKSLNEANKQHIQEEKEKIEAEKRAREQAESLEQDKRYYAETLVDDFYNLLEVYGIELNPDEGDDSVDVVLRLMDTCAPIFQALINFKPSSTTIPEVEKNEEDPIGDFLRLFVDKT